MEIRKPIPDVLDIGEIESLGARYPDTETRALFYFLYLTGCRITEALHVHTRDISIHSVKGVGTVVKVKLITLKNRRNKFREIPILNNGSENGMLEYVFKFIEGKDPEEFIFKIKRDVAWHRFEKQSITVRAVKGREILEAMTLRMHPHYLRHCRATHLRSIYRFDMWKLMKYFGWTSPEPARIYDQGDWMEFLDIMRKDSAS